MTTDLIVFLGLALVAVGAAVGLIASRNAVYSALFLILNFSTVAVFYLILGAPFIALTQITVYAGAIMVLFLFVIMLLGAEQMGHASPLRWQRPLALFLGVMLTAEAAYIFLTNRAQLPGGGQAGPTFGSPVMVGEVLFNQYLLPFEVISILLLTAMIGAIVLSHSKS